MPQFKILKTTVIQTWISDFVNYFITDKFIVYYISCKKSVQCNKKQQINQHINSAMHTTKNKQCAADVTKQLFQAISQFLKQREK